MKVKIGECGVDAGMLMVGDPCYFIGKDATINEHCKSWKQACDEIFCKDGVGRDTPMDVYSLGVAISTTHGDGCYPVFLETTKSGRRRLIVNLD